MDAAEEKSATDVPALTWPCGNNARNQTKAFWGGGVISFHLKARRMSL